MSKHTSITQTGDWLIGPEKVSRAARNGLLGRNKYSRTLKENWAVFWSTRILSSRFWERDCDAISLTFVLGTLTALVAVPLVSVMWLPAATAVGGTTAAILACGGFHEAVASMRGKAARKAINEGLVVDLRRETFAKCRELLAKAQQLQSANMREETLHQAQKLTWQLSQVTHAISELHENAQAKLGRQGLAVVDEALQELSSTKHQIQNQVSDLLTAVEKAIKEEDLIPAQLRAERAAEADADARGELTSQAESAKALAKFILEDTSSNTAGELVGAYTKALASHR